MPINPSMIPQADPNQQQDPSQQQSGINFGLLAPQNTPKQGIIAHLAPPAPSGDSDGGIGELLSGLKSLVGIGGGAKTQMSPQATNAAINQPTQLTPASYQGLQNQQQQPATSGVNPGYSPQSGQSIEQSVYNNANKMLGVGGNNPVMQQYLQKANPGLNPEATPWCAGFVGSVLNASGVKGTGSLSARSYLNYGQPTSKPTMGDIVVLSRGNDPKLGHVGFYAGTDENGNVKVLAGNHNDSVGVGSYPSSRVLGYRVPPSAQQVAQFAKQNGINSPQQLSSITKNSAQNMSSQQTLDTIKQFEGYDKTAKWDVNAYRAGYGSDTVTRPDGSVTKVTPGMQVSQEDADRDLARRTQEFETTATHQVGQQNWSKLSPGAQSALTSVAYNYGSLPKSVVQAVQTGSPSVIAGAVRALGGANGGVNRQRRNQEASMIVAPGSPQAMNSRQIPNSSPIRQMSPESVEAIMKSQGSTPPPDLSNVG